MWIVVPGHSGEGLGCILPTRVGAIIAKVNLRREHGECLASLYILEQCSSALTRCFKKSKRGGMWLTPKTYCCWGRYVY
jgi:hypothetical protein